MTLGMEKINRKLLLQRKWHQTIHQSQHSLKFITFLNSLCLCSSICVHKITGQLSINQWMDKVGKNYLPLDKFYTSWQTKWKHGEEHEKCFLLLSESSLRSGNNSPSLSNTVSCFYWYSCTVKSCSLCATTCPFEA